MRPKTFSTSDECLIGMTPQTMYVSPKSPAIKVAAYPIVTHVTCVASQSWVSSTACRTVNVSPSAERMNEIWRVTNPAIVARTLPIPRRKIGSNARPSATQPQPMNTADEYRFVTGGRPEMYIREASAKVCRQNVKTINQYAARLRGFVHPSQATTDSRKPQTYKK